MDYTPGIFEMDINKLNPNSHTHANTTSVSYTHLDVYKRQNRLLFPIPQTEMDANTLMVPNPGY